MIANEKAPSAGPVFRICRREEWVAAQAAGSFQGSEMDIRDGFIHLSSGRQLLDTLHAHFRDVRDLVVLKVDPVPLAGDLRWEPSRGGEDFPHLYSPLPVSAVLEVMPLPDEPARRAKLSFEF